MLLHVKKASGLIYKFLQTEDGFNVFDGIPDKMREIVVQPRSRLSPADRQASARVDFAGFGEVTRYIAPGMRVLMRPS